MRQTIFDDSKLSLFQQALNDQFAQIQKIPFINGNLLEDVDLTTGANVVNHGLQRVPVGYLVFANSANTVIWNNALDSDITITLNCSANATVTVWVF